VSASAPTDIAQAVGDVALWYHTIELPDGSATPGWFDLRPIVGRMPFPDVRGMRCLDVGTYDGFLAFELERRGAREVVATDVSDHGDWDWPARMRERGPAALAQIAGGKGRGFEVARELLGSSVRKVELSAYDLSPELVGTFDVVVCGSLLLHLREPVRALEAIRSVCAGSFLSAEQVELGLSLRHPRTPVSRLNAEAELCQWWLPNVAAHRQMLVTAGFRVQRATRPYAIPFGAAHPAVAPRLLRRVAAGGQGVPHAAALARPDL
jgi:tRNA (mo5U34)-methyltransferase